ncbi:hypothetical protein AAVH_19382, partial [Aphelenchoides avenae]
ASTVSLRTHSIRISVILARVEDEGLRDFAPYLFYRARDDLLIYDFPDAHDGEDAAMHLQVAFRPSVGYLQIVRARRTNRLFYEQDE